MRLTVFSPDIPYPPTRGGRADIWRRLLAFERLGFKVHLVNFYDDEPGKRPSAEDTAKVLQHVAAHTQFPIVKGLTATTRRLPHIVHTPWHVVCRSLPRAELDRLVQAMRTFGTQLLWTEGPWCGRVVQTLAQALQLPYVYRSHNIEHCYMAKQAAAARRPRDRLAWTIACLGLERFERQMIDGARWVFDISCDDLAFWQSQGVRHASWLPPLAESQLQPSASELPPLDPVHDVLFLGNLTTPNNVRGVEWLVHEVRPRVLAQRPDTQFLIAGSNPGAHVRQLCEQPQVRLLANVPDAVGLYRASRVLVNPVRTGSGTHMKAIEMLMTRAPIVTTTQGTMGMPDDIKRLFQVADTADGFAQAILTALSNGGDEWDRREPARRLFSPPGLADALRVLPDLGKQRALP